ncbi:MAG: hypothetical protein OXU75_03145, partial [Deltaproteobacteria bacterium]|nr:hypothetical protein [Deltaproteobacteria bacterium]
MDILSRTARRLKVRLLMLLAWPGFWCCVGAELALGIVRRLAHSAFAWWALLLGLALLAALASSSHAQDALVGYEDGSLDIFTPVEVVDAGGGAILSDSTPKVAGTAAPGVSGEASRDDHVHPAAGGGTATPLSNAAARNLGVAAAGVSTDASRADHVHSQTSFLGVGIPGPATVSGAVGVSTLSARGDHVHRSQIPALTGHGGNCLKANSGATGLEFSACGGGS